MVNLRANSLVRKKQIFIAQIFWLNQGPWYYCVSTSFSEILEGKVGFKSCVPQLKFRISKSLKSNEIMQQA
jgi:hypothetical protein